IGKAGKPVLAPAIGAAARLIVGEIIPCRAAGAVILAHRPPLPFAKVRTPKPPILLAVAAFLDALALGVGNLRHGGRIGYACYCFAAACVSRRQESSV